MHTYSLAFACSHDIDTLPLLNDFLFRFTGSVKLKSFVLIGGEGGMSPAHVKVFVNRDDIDFDNAEVREVLITLNDTHAHAHVLLNTILS